MPAPGAKRRNQQRSGSSRNLSNVDIPTVLDAYIDEVNDANDWEGVVCILCRIFDLPEIERRSGLRRIHANFTDIQQKLEATYTKYQSNEKVVGGVVGIWARMCVDSILRNKLVSTGVIDKMLPLLDTRSTRIVGLEAISAVNHHGGEEVRREIAGHTPKFLGLMDQFPDNARMNELIISIFAHSVSCVVSDTPASTQDIKRLDIPNVLRHIVISARNPSASSYMLSHAFSLLASCTLNCSREVKAFPSSVSLLIACMRSEDITIRCCALGGLFRLLSAEGDTGPSQLDHYKLLAIVQRGFPDHITRNLLTYGPHRCDTFLTLQCSGEFQKAMMKCIQDKDLLSLGRTLGRLITTTEYSTAEGVFESVNPRTGKPEYPDVGLPFKMWSDALPICASALRNTGEPKDMDLADILDLKFLIQRQKISEAMDHAQRAIARNPQQAYFYYAFSLTADHEKGLKMCKKGLQCKQTTPFVKSYLRWRAVDHAGELGITKLSNASAGDSAYVEGIAFLTSALEDAKAFVSEAPPDSRNMETMLNWVILLSLALRGNEISPDLRQLNDTFGKLAFAEEIQKHLGGTNKKTNLKITRELVVSRYQASWTEWEATIKRYNTLTGCDNRQEHAEDQAEDNLATWLEGLHVEGEEDGHRCTHPRTVNNTVPLYHCSFCHNPSAILRKCGGCGKTKYCDASCQKMHWQEHKAACRAAQA